MMLDDIPKKELIEEIRFEEGKDDKSNVIRLDHVGPSLYPLIISSNLPVATDSLGILSFKLQKDTLHNFLKMIDNVTPKMHSRKLDQVLIRVAYRFNGRQALYYVTNPIISAEFLKLIEKKLIDNRDLIALDKFYQFIAEMKLQIAVDGKRTWKY